MRSFNKSRNSSIPINKKRDYKHIKINNVKVRDIFTFTRVVFIAHYTIDQLINKKIKLIQPLKDQDSIMSKDKKLSWDEVGEIIA